MRTALLATVGALAASPTTALVTSYCPGSSGEITASGEHVHAGIVATESRSIPFGTRIRFTPAVLGRRVYRVEDRMGLGDAASFDVWTASCSRAIAWGIRHVRFTVTYPRHHHS
ncbi:MAG TPA: hypothetical protein VHX66_00265 [Solirubrobacteraceae bacterium]|nr:hypothetical protein [Solirubrobacteraceae bacterium]